MSFTSRIALSITFFCAALGGRHLLGEELPLVAVKEVQPLKAQTGRVIQALELVGAPLTDKQKQAYEQALKEPNDAKSAQSIQKILDPLCLAGVNINPESRVKVTAGEAKKELVQQGWRVFLIKVHNEGGVTAPLNVTSPNAAPIYARSSNKSRPEKSVSKDDAKNRWLDLALYTSQPLIKELSGFNVEYRIVGLYSQDAGQREAKLEFDVGQGTQDLGFRNEVNLLFQCEKAVEVVLELFDVDGEPTTGSFVFKDRLGRVYPSRAKRLAPDFFFHDQIYRHHGESVTLPPGDYEVTYTRGPEYKILSRPLHVAGGKNDKQTETFRLERWIKLADHGWFSGDHHVHGAGCAHYEAPTEGVGPEDMMRHILGEDLNVGCVLTWGPCWYFQKSYFEGQVHKLSQPRYLMRYDVEVSGFPSSHSGHLCLLRLIEDDYPGTSEIEQWPSWDLPVLAWGKSQGGVVGFSHSGWGLEVPAQSLPTYDMPPFNGIGANEFIVDTVHGVCDFISAVDTPFVWEMNIWYHTLNCGYTTRISGETDFPCIYGERVGLGRGYVKMDAKPGESLDFNVWADGIRDGKSYCCDGLTHLIDFKVNDLGVGEKGADGRASVLATKSGEPLSISLKAAGLLEEKPNEEIRKQPLHAKPYWHIERARAGNSRQIPVELIVNGVAVEKKLIDADGSIHDITFEYTPKFSSWVAIRVFPSAHTNPIFVEVDGKPIRASKKSAQWCLDAVDVCWKSKSPQIREGAERTEAEQAFEVARQAYRKVLEESHAD